MEAMDPWMSFRNSRGAPAFRWIIKFSTNEEMYAKIISGSADYDVLIPSDYMIGKMIDEGLLAKLDFSNIPNYRYVDDAFKI